MTQTKPDMEQLTIGTIIDGFNTQAMGMPGLCERFFELEGEFTKEDHTKSMELYQDIMKSKAAGINLSVVILAAYYILAELVMQRNAHLNTSDPAITNKDPDTVPGYG